MDVVVVTGGNGFVGQHLIKLLHQHCQSEVKEIRVFDIRPFTQKLDYETTIPTVSIEGDICDMAAVSRAVRGASCVFHVAGVISIGTSPDTKLLQRINVEGTNVVVEACLMNSVPRFVQTSSVDAVSPLRDCVEETEATMPYPPVHQLVMPQYASSKMEAEKMTIGADGRPLADGSGVFRTVSVRPTGMYGELDFHLIATLIRRAASRGGVAVVIGPKNEQPCVHDIAYVGNTAWAHICAMRALRDKPEACGGKAYFITDDSPRMIFFDHTIPFMHERGFRIASFQIPFRLAYFLILLLQTLVRLLRPFKAINLPVNTRILDYINYNYTYRRTRAATDLDYKPLFTYEEAVHNSKRYYKNMPV